MADHERQQRDPPSDDFHQGHQFTSTSRLVSPERPHLTFVPTPNGTAATSHTPALSSPTSSQSSSRATTGPRARCGSRWMRYQPRRSFAVWSRSASHCSTTNRCPDRLSAGPLAVFAPWPAAWSPLPFLELLLGAADPSFSGRLLLGILDPADEFVAGERRDVLPRVERFRVGDQRLAQVSRQPVHHPTRNSRSAHTSTVVIRTSSGRRIVHHHGHVYRSGARTLSGVAGGRCRSPRPPPPAPAARSTR